LKLFFKFALVIGLTAIATYVGTAYFVQKNAWASFVALSYDMEAHNTLYRIESWDRLEQLLVKGCHKEAMEYVKMEQSLGLSGLRANLDNGAKLEKKVEDENYSILNRAKSFVSKGTYDVPTCK